MLSEKIILQSAGSLSVAILALLMLILQTLFFLKKPQFTWYAWSAAASFSALLYSVGIFIEYNTPEGTLNRISGLLEFTAIICLIHCLYGFTFSYLGMENKRYHPVAGVWHGLILIILWGTNYIVADSFATRHFIGMTSPYIEPALGPLGPLFILYVAIAGVNAMIIWIRHKGTDPKLRIIYVAGMGFWILLGIHDGLAAMGLPTLQYFMEYGFLGFAMAVLWVVFNNYFEIVAEEKYHAITEAANDGILVIQDGRMVFRNPACSNLIGLSSADSAARHFFDIMASEDRETVLKHYDVLLEGGRGPNPHTVLIREGDEEQRFVEIASSLIRYRNRPAVLAIMRDMTERRRKEEALRESEEKLNRSKKMEFLGLLAGGVAHDLNNVLSGIISYPELMLIDLPEDSKLRKPIETMQNSGHRAVAIVQDLLTVARGVVTTKEPLELNDIVNEYLHSAEFKKLTQFHPAVTFRSDLDNDLFNISGSRIHLAKVVMNMVSNASEAINGNGNVTLSTMNSYVDKPISGYDAVKTGKYAILSVSDDGSGIPSVDLKRIFEPFFTKKEMGRSGTGLGLAVVWNIVQDHKGYIEVVSNKNGTTFKLYFPITQEKVPDKDFSLPIKDYKGCGETILVIDDVESQRDITCRILVALGYKVEAVNNGADAVKYLTDHTVDMVLLDMIMDPGMGGRETYEKITKIHPKQKAIIISGFSETDEVRETQKLGAGRYIKKPFTLEQIGTAIKGELHK